MDYEYKKGMDKKEMIDFLRKLAEGIEKDNINVHEIRNFSIKKPFFTLEYEVKEKDYGRKLEIEIRMKDYG